MEIANDWVPLSPGRWVVEVRTGGHVACRIDADDVAHGGSRPDLPVPGVNAWLDDFWVEQGKRGS